MTPLVAIWKKRMHRLPENMFILNLGQDRFINQTIKFLGPTGPFLIFKNRNIFTQIEQKGPY